VPVFHPVPYKFRHNEKESIMNEKPRLVPIPEPADPEADRRDLSKPFPIEYGGRWYVLADELKGVAPVYH
jgi:hypothetical protein